MVDSPTRRPLSHEQTVTLTVFAAAFLTFLPSLSAGFVFDDKSLILQNEYVHAWRWVPRAFTTHFWDVMRTTEESDLRRYYRPLVTLSYLATWVAVGARAWVFHLTNVLLHATTAALATRAALRWTRWVFGALAVGLVFAVHPSRSENVTWISGRTDVLMMFFLLLSLEAFAAFDRESRRSWVAFAVGLVALAAALLSKEPAVLLPVILLAERSSNERRSRLPIVAAAIACGVYIPIRVLALPSAMDASTLTPLHGLMTIGAYVQRIVIPWPPTMYYHALVYDAAGPVYSKPLVLVGTLTSAALIAALVVAWRRCRTAFWLLLASAGFLGPLLNFRPTGMNVSAQDRFLYAPLLFGAAGVAALAAPKLRPLAERRVARILVVGVSLIFAGVVVTRALDFQSDRTFWEAELRENPTNPFVLQSIAQEAASRGDLEAAYDYYRRAASPEAQKYRLARDSHAHFQQATILAALLPDGRPKELRGLLDELWRLVEPDRPAPRGRVLDLELGEPLAGVERLAREATFQWDIALLATRLGDMKRAERALEGTHGDLALASANPLNDALALARMGRAADARAVYQRVLSRSEELGAIASSQDVRDFGRRLDRSEQLAAERDRAPDAVVRSTTEALRLAELGAYLAALRELERGGGIEAPQATPLVLQLLVACRLEDAARAFAAARLDAERAVELVRTLTAQLPPRLREMEPVPGTLEEIVRQPAAPPR